MPSRNNDEVTEALAHASDLLVSAVAATGSSHPVVLIDGRSGAGKTTLSRLVEERWPLSEGVQRIALDSLYQGWDGLDAGVNAAYRDVLIPHSHGEEGAWRRWDWNRDEEAESHPVDPREGLILEGCGALTPATAPLAGVRVWVEAPDDVRKRRALSRDGDAFRPHWDRWAAQERVHIERDAPRGLATVIVIIP